MGVVGHGGGTAGLHRQTRLGAIEGLHLALLIATQHQRMLGRRHIQTDDVFELLGKLGVTRHLEALDAVRLQAMRRPNALDRGVADASHRRQRPRTPLGRPLRLGLRRQTHNLRRVDLGLAPAARQILLDGLQSARRVALTPTPHLNPAHAKQLANPVIVQPVRRQQHDARATRQAHFRRIRMRQLHQLFPLRVVQFNDTCLPHFLLQSASYTPWIRRVIDGSINYDALH